MGEGAKKGVKEGGKEWVGTRVGGEENEPDVVQLDSLRLEMKERRAFGLSLGFALSTAF